MNSKLNSKEKNLKIQLLVSKLNSVISKRLERTKFAALNEIKVHCVKSRSLDRLDKNFDIFSMNTTNNTGHNKEKLMRLGTDSEFKKTQYSTNHNVQQPLGVTNRTES